MIYEYECKACGKQFEYQQRMSDPEKTLCEACGKEALERIISRTAFQLKGGGWYKDLYASTKPEPAKTEASAPVVSSDAAAAPAAATPAAPATPAATPAKATPTPSTGSSGSGGAT